MTRVALYRRVSTEEQATEGYSLQAQKTRLTHYALAEGWTIVEDYVDDGFTGRNVQRPAYKRMMAEMDRWDVLLVLKMDRIHRNSRNFTAMMDDLRSKKREFASAMEKLDTQTAMGRFVMDIIQRIAQLESEQTGERVYMGMAAKVESGPGWFQQAPFGYRVHESNLQPEPAQAEWVRRIFDHYTRPPFLSTAALATMLNDAGVRTNRDNPWTNASVRQILSNPVYTGRRVWEQKVLENNHPPIIDLAVFEAAARQLKKNQYRGSQFSYLGARMAANL